MTHGGNLFEIQRQYGVDRNGLLDYSANINPLGVPNSLRKIMMEAMDDLVNYPDIHYTDLKNAIGEKYKVTVDNIYVGNGGVQVIFDFINAVKPEKSLVVYPTFVEYERALKAVGSEIKTYLLNEDNDFKLHIDELINEIDETLDMVVLCNPNNPTGTLIEREFFEKLLIKCQEKEVFLMVDEAFMDFVHEGEEKTLLTLSEKYEYLMVTRSFTKFYGIPGLRLGFGVCCHIKIKQKLTQLAIPWTVNTFASYFGKVLLTDQEYERKTLQWLREETPRFVNELEKTGLFKVYQPSVNYILMKLLPKNIEVNQLREKLIQEGVLIRDCSNFKGLSNRFIRIAIKDTGSNQQLLDAINKVIVGLDNSL